MARRLAVGIFNAGWLVPLWQSADCVRRWCEDDLLPRIDGGGPYTSAPFLDVAELWLTVAAVWLGAVIVVRTMLAKTIPAAAAEESDG